MIGKDVKNPPQFLADAVKEKIRSDLKTKLTEEVVNPLLDEVIAEILSHVDIKVYNTLHPEQMMAGFAVDINDTRGKD